MYLLGKSTSESADFIETWKEKSNVDLLHTLGRVKTYLFQTLNNPNLFHSMSEWLSEKHYLNYRNSTKYQKIIENSKLENKPDLVKLRLINHWIKNITDRSYFTLIRFTSDSEIDFIQSKLDFLKEEPEYKYGVDEIYFFTGFESSSVFTLLIGWDSLQSLESLTDLLRNKIHEFSFLELDYSHIFQIKLVYTWVENLI